MAVIERAPAGAIPDAAPELAPRSTESDGVVAVVMDFVGAALPQFDDLLELQRSGPHRSRRVGSLFQWSRATPDGVRVTEVWQSADHFEVFLHQEIRSRLDQAGLPEPEITTYDVHSYLTEGPAAEPATDNYPAWTSES